jgi:type II secretory pathway pseudopilin PulG
MGSLFVSGNALTAVPRARAGGFTYVGLLLLVAIMAVWLVAVSQVWYTMQKREKEEELLFVGDQYRRALAAYYASSAAYPKRLEDLLKDPRFPAVRRYLRKLYPDPVTGKAEWGFVKGPDESITGVYSLSEAEPLKKSGFRVVDEAFEGKTKYSEWVFLPRTGRMALPAAPGTAAKPLPGNQPSITPPAAARSAPGVVFTTPAQMGQGSR